MTTAGPEHTTATHRVTPSVRRHIEELVLILLVLLSGLGVAINDLSPKSAFGYWMWMAPTFGVISVGAAWYRAARSSASIPAAVWRQVLHWAGVIGAVYLVYLLQRTGRLANEAAGDAALILIGLAAFLAGVHSDWRLMVLGVVLGITVVGIAVVEQIIWVVVLPLMAIGVVILLWYVRKARHHIA